MPLWIIEPHDPLIVRDGKPFGPNPGARAQSLAFPFPSTTTGGLRNRAGVDAHGVFDRSNIAAVKQIAMRGPLLVELDQTDNGMPTIARWLMPAPADALLLKPEHASPDAVAAQVVRKRLVPLHLPEGGMTNLPDTMLPVGQAYHRESKVHKQAPAFWYWDQVQQWLIAPPTATVAFEDTLALKDLGHNGPTRETRMHVSIDRERQTAREGALFQTSGLEFTCVDRPRDVTDQTSALSQARRLALVVVADTDQTAQFSRIAALGGERRMVVWREPKGDIPACHAEVITNVAAQVRREQACRVVLLTPACFTAGWRPTWLLAPRGGVQPTLQAVAVQRPHVVSGWDFEHDRPKPTRRLAPAGTVLFLTLAGSADAIEQWVTTIWMQCVSDDAQDRLDGFGLAIIGTWDGTPHPQMMQQKQEQQS